MQVSEKRFSIQKPGKQNHSPRLHCGESLCQTELPSACPSSSVPTSLKHHIFIPQGVLDKGGIAALWTTDPSLLVLSLQTVTTLEFHPAPSLCFHATYLLYCHQPLFLIHVSHPSPNTLFSGYSCPSPHLDSSVLVPPVAHSCRSANNCNRRCRHPGAAPARFGFVIFNSSFSKQKMQQKKPKCKN